MHRRIRPAGRLALVVAGTALASIGLAACGSGNSSPAAPAPTPSTPGSATSSATSGGGTSAKGVITIKKYAYTGTTTVAPGASVTVMNEDSVAHTVTADRAPPSTSRSPEVARRP